jgi:hypothetical protein
MRWKLSHRADPFARDIADRHYNRQKIGSPQFVPPGRCLVLTAHTDTGRALWVTSWPFAEYVKHAWPGAWVCSAFRNENAAQASDLIREAVAASLARWQAPPLGMITFLDRRAVKPIKRHGVPTWGHTWRLAGFKHVGETKGGLMAWQLLPADMPVPSPAVGTQPDIFGDAA